MFLFSCLKGDVSRYPRDFSSYGQIGVFGGFESHLQEIERLQRSNSPLSDEKYRKEKYNKLGPVYSVRSLRNHMFPVLTLAWSRSEPGLLTSVGKDSRLVLWDVGECQKLCSHHVGGGEDMIMSVAISPDNKLLACGGVGNVCRVLRRGPSQDAIAETGTIFSEHEGFIPTCAFMDNARVLTGSGDHTCKIFDVGNPSAAVASFRHESDVMATALRLHPDGSVTEFYSASANMITMWDSRAPPESPAVRIGLEKADDITSLSACPSRDHFVACGTEGGDVWVYDLRSSDGRRPRCVAAGVDAEITQTVSSVAFAHSGSYVFAGYRSWVKRYMDCVLAAFDVSSACYGDAVAETVSDAAQEGAPILAPHCVIGDNSAIVSPSQPFSYSYQSCHSTFVSSVQVNCDGCALATASHDGTVTVFRQQR